LSEIDRRADAERVVGPGRTQGVGALTAAGGDQPLALGPMLRASGVAYDVRKDNP